MTAELTIGGKKITLVSTYFCEAILVDKSRGRTRAVRRIVVEKTWTSYGWTSMHTWGTHTVQHGDQRGDYAYSSMNKRASWLKQWMIA